ncbi:MAG: CotH kinase family protein [Williamsia sp.]|nr:CotH kinase family protein [Williamsia sp.]
MKQHLYLLCLLMFLLITFLNDVVAQDTTLTNLPTFYITTENGAPIVSEDDYINGSLHVAGGSPDSGYYNGDIEIRGRGNSTWTFPKKPYKIKLASKYNLLGMPAKAKAWVLLANWADKTLMRNALAFETSKFFGFAFTPSYRMADVVLNGDYIGTYTITDQVEQGDNRVDVEDLDEDDTGLPTISGGYLLSTGNQPLGDDPHYDTRAGMHYSIKYPDDPDDINDAQRAYITNYIQQFETVLYSSGYKNPKTGYRRMFDIRSGVDGYLLNEICGNGDCFHSNYMYKHRDDSLLYTGPMWDYDIAFDNDYRLGETKYKYMYDWAFGPYDAYGKRVWYSRITDDEYFYQQVRSRFFEMKKAGLQKRMLYVIDSLSALLQPSQALNFKRWPILKEKVWMNPVALGSYDKEVKYLRNYVVVHTTWLNGEYVGLPPGTPMRIVGEQSGKALQIRDCATIAGSDVVQYTINSNPSQRWNVTNLNNGYYAISNLNSGMVITNNESTNPNVVLQQAPFAAGKRGQQWRIINVGGGQYGLINRLSGYAADLAFENLDDNAYVMQWDNHIYDVKPNQHWSFQKVAPAAAATADTAAVSFTLSPNPAATAGTVTARITLPKEVPVSIFVYDARGLLMQEVQKGKLPKGTSYVSLPVGRLQKGYYTVTVQAGDAKASRLLMK